jgi:hypothetical protein
VFKVVLQILFSESIFNGDHDSTGNALVITGDCPSIALIVSPLFIDPRTKGEVNIKGALSERKTLQGFPPVA